MSTGHCWNCCLAICNTMMWRALKFSKQVGFGASSFRNSCELCVGTRLMGVVEPCGLGEFIPHEGVASAESLRAECSESNAALLNSLRPDEFGGSAEYSLGTKLVSEFI